MKVQYISTIMIGQPPQNAVQGDCRPVRWNAVLPADWIVVRVSGRLGKHQLWGQKESRWRPDFINQRNQRLCKNRVENMTYFPLRQTTCFFIPLVAPCKPLLVKIKKHFNQSTMSLLFYVILFYIIFLVFASLRSVQSGPPLDVLHPCICPYQSS